MRARTIFSIELSIAERAWPCCDGGIGVMAHEALDQGALLTAEDLAYRIFNCGLRTISRDLKMGFFAHPPEMVHFSRWACWGCASDTHPLS